MVSDSEFAGVMDFGVGTVKGVRSFEVDPLGRLRGLNYSQVWKPGENEAQCLKYQGPYSTALGLTNSPPLPVGGLSHYMGVPVVGGRMTMDSWTMTRRVELSLADGRNIGLECTAEAWDEIVKQNGGDGGATFVFPKHEMANCRCGFYGYYDGSDDFKRDATVSAVVEGYGEVLIGTRGFRASKARVLALCIPEAAAVEPKKPKRTLPLVRWFAKHDSWGSTAFAVGLAGLLFWGIGAVVDASQGTLLEAGILGPLALLFGYLGLTAFLSLDYDDSRRADSFVRAVREIIGTLSPEMIAKIRRNYPDVPIFTSFESMITEYPPDTGIEPNPDTDPNFWERNTP
jgi:hypothetical protein